MTLTLDFWQLLTTIGSVTAVFVGCVWALGKLLLAQYDKRLQDRFNSHEKIEQELYRVGQERVQAIADALATQSTAVIGLERQLLAFKAEMPVSYVRREDWVRSQSILEAKIDGLGMRMENIMLRKKNDA